MKGTKKLEKSQRLEKVILDARNTKIIIKDKYPELRIDDYLFDKRNVINADSSSADEIV